MLNEILKKLSSYNILNYLLPGVLFGILVDAFTCYEALLDETLIGLFLYYFYGFAVSRIGSLIIQPILEKLKIIKFAPYADYIKASKQDPKIEILSETNNMFRTFVSLFVLVGGVVLYEFVENLYPFLIGIRMPLLIVTLLCLTIFSYRKQTQYIVSRIQNNLNK